MPFLGAHPSLLQALIERGLTEPTAVQRAILESDPNADLLVSAETGSGKTVAFGLSIAPTVLGDAARFPAVPRERGKMLGPLVLIVAPTRELAMQVARELTWLYAHAGGAVATCIGGMDVKREHQALARGPQFVVGTPGRLCDHLGRGALVLDRIQAVVLDEADEMLDMGFRDELEKILQAIPKTQLHRTLLFSATIPPGIAALAKRYQREAIRIATADDRQPHADIELRAIAIRPADRIGATVNVLRFHEARTALVFCATRDGVQGLARELASRGFSVVALSGELSQRERTSALAQVREGRARVLVATDVAARGLDLPELELVVQADLPNNRDVMIHRSGRTGRAGRKGTAILLVPLPRRGFVERVLASRAAPIAWVPVPSADEIVERDLARLDTDLVREIAELGDRDRELGRLLAARFTAEDLAAMVVRGHLTAAPAPVAIQSFMPPAPSAAASSSRSSHPGRPSHPGGPAHPGHPGRTSQPRPSHPRRSDHPSHPHPLDPPEAPFPSASAPRDDRAPPPSRDAADYVVFRVNVGRRGKADPKWLIPILCRRGEIDRRSIGKIRILGGETHVEIARSQADSFATAVARPDPRDRNIHITPLGA